VLNDYNKDDNDNMISEVTMIINNDEIGSNHDDETSKEEY
jgi:hypothetical protein